MCGEADLSSRSAGEPKRLATLSLSFREQRSAGANALPGHFRARSLSCEATSKAGRQEVGASNGLLASPKPKTFDCKGWVMQRYNVAVLCQPSRTC